MNLQAYVDDRESTLDPQTCMPGRAFKGPGYHSTFEDGTWVHETREALDYVLALLKLEHPQASVRVPKIISSVLALQQTDPTHPTYGIWPWLYEEPLEQMAPPDFNWADFIGVRLAQLLKCHTHQLDENTQEQLRTALNHAAWSIFRRNMHAGYTNIAVMGALCTAAAGELLDQPKLLEYAQIRFQNVVDHVAFHQSFVEYNSPTYTTVLLEECSRAYVLCEDPLVRALCNELLTTAWQIIGEHFHPATHQWAGPHARAYKQLLTPFINQTIGHGLDRHIPVHPLNHDQMTHQAHLFATHPCPDELLGLFDADKTKIPLTIHCQFVDHGKVKQVGTTWMNDTATLGSINIEDTWNQRRPVLAYWKTANDPAVSLRVRFLHDGYDFASGQIRTVQKDNNILIALNLLDNKGDTHVGLDRPEKPVFNISSLKLQWELAGQDVSVDRIDETRFEFVAGDYRAILHTAHGQFADQKITWDCETIEGGVSVTATCYKGDPRDFDLREIKVFRLACALELIPNSQIANDQKIQIQPVDTSGYKAQWGDHELTVPQACESYLA